MCVCIIMCVCVCVYLYIYLDIHNTHIFILYTYICKYLCDYINKPVILSKMQYRIYTIFFFIT